MMNFWFTSCDAVLQFSHQDMMPLPSICLLLSSAYPQKIVFLETTCRLLNSTVPAQTVQTCSTWIEACSTFKHVPSSSSGLASLETFQVMLTPVERKVDTSCNPALSMKLRPFTWNAHQSMHQNINHDFVCNHTGKLNCIYIEWA